MKTKNTLTFALLLIVLTSWAQPASMNENLSTFLQTHQSRLALTDSELDDFQTSSRYTDERTGVTHYYLDQTKNGIIIKNAMLILAEKNGVIMHIGNSCIKELDKVNTVGAESVGASDAAVHAAIHVGVVRPEKPSAPRGKNEQGYFELSKTSYTRSPILSRPIYEYDGKSLILCHEIVLEMANSADHWQISVSQKDGKIIGKNNLTTYCTFEKNKWKHQDKCDHTHDVSSNKNELIQPSIKEQNSITTMMVVPKYRVYPLPAESPSHGQHVLVTDPSDKIASPQGWNTIDSRTYNITRGNNTNVFLDENDDDLIDLGTEAKPKDSLQFDFVHDKTKEPGQSAAAAQTNLFYMINMMHDITFRYGFNEVAGNFQQKNYSTLGRGNDQVNGNVFDGFKANPIKVDNANFNTPVDGSPGKMQMFLWTQSAGALSLTAPAESAREFTEYGTGDFGEPIPSFNAAPVSGIAAIGTDNTTNPGAGCATIKENLTGKIALINRGLCDFSQKVYNAQRAGAVACIICNIVGVNGGNGEEIINMGGATNATLVTIPSLFLRKSDCDFIKNLIAKGINPVLKLQNQELNGPAYRDGAFDNGIIAHEYGHGISNRLTGGPNNTSCLNNDEQMGEGWSDFFSLVTTVKEGDKGTDARGIGTYAIGEPIAGKGIRRYAYSTDMTVNPQTFKDIKGTTSPHQLGEIWSDMLWDLYWAMVEKHGFDADITKVNTGNGKAISLVMEGMKLQSCRPSFIDGRDAILAADLILYGGENSCLIWKVFARRGLGYTATSGSSLDINDGTESFEALPTCIEKLKITKNSPEVATAGQVVTISLNAINHIPRDINSVVIEDDIPLGAQYVNGSATLPTRVVNGKLEVTLGNMKYLDEKNLTYQLVMPNIKSQTIKLYSVDNGTDGFDVIPIEGFDTWTVSDKAKSGKEAFFIQATNFENDHALITPTIKVSGNKPVLRFFHRYETQNVNDGGYVSISTNNGSSWDVLDGKYMRNGPKEFLNYSLFAIPSLLGYTGSSKGLWLDTYIDLKEFQGKDALFRFRFGTDTTSATIVNAGWAIDDIELMDASTGVTIACIDDATKNNKNCTASNIIILNSDVALDAKIEKLDVMAMSIYPNPTASAVNINFNAPNQTEASISIVGMDGKIWQQGSLLINAGNQIIVRDVSQLPSGVYYVVLGTEKYQTTKKLIIQK